MKHCEPALNNEMSTWRKFGWLEHTLRKNQSEVQSQSTIRRGSGEEDAPKKLDVALSWRK